MHIKLRFLFLLVLILLINTTNGDKNKKNKSVTGNHKRHTYSRGKAVYGRLKRSLNEDETPFWPTRGRRVAVITSRFNSDLENSEKVPSNDKEPPFWGTRGRRDSASTENVGDSEFPSIGLDTKYLGANCKHCYKSPNKDYSPIYEQSKERRDELNVPFWGNRGRRNSDESDDDNNLPSSPFWGNRGRRQEDDPFWGARGRRQEETPFWGNRGRRHSWSFTEDEDPLYWGNRGRRDENEPFWGARGRRPESDPFWGSRGRRENKNKHKENLKDVLLEAINKVEDNIESLTRIRRDSNGPLKSFWNHRGRDSKLKYLFKGNRHRYPSKFLNPMNKPSESRTVLDDRMFAEQPHYIIVERSSRSSSEDDPFFISRGKKKVLSFQLNQSNRNRRGAIEELVKSVRNDPYYIARGKKDGTKIGNDTMLQKEFGKAKELICATLELLFKKYEGNKTKREVDENDRDRRTILKKLAAQLQMDPYFVTRGKKKNSDVNEDNLENFIDVVSAKCN